MSHLCRRPGGVHFARVEVSMPISKPQRELVFSQPTVEVLILFLLINTGPGTYTRTFQLKSFHLMVFVFVSFWQFN